MFKKRWVRRLLIILGAVVLVLGSITIYNARTGVYSQYGSINSRNKLIGTRVTALAKAVRGVPGVTRVALNYNPLHLPEPASTVKIRVDARALPSQAASALNRADAYATAERLPQTTLTIELTYGSTTIIHTGGRTADAVNGAAISATSIFRRASGAKMRLAIAGVDELTRIEISAPGAAASEFARVVGSYPSTLGPLNAPKSTQWMLPGLISRSGLPPRAALVQLSAELAAVSAPAATRPGASLHWSGANPSQSTLCVFATGSQRERIADLGARVFAANASPVGNFCVSDSSTSLVSTHQLHSGECMGTLTATAADRAYLIHLLQIKIPLPPSIVAGRCRS